MAKAKLSLAREYVDYWLEHLAGEVSHTPSSERCWSRLGPGSYADVLHVLEVGRVTQANKEEAHVSEYEIIGTTIDGEHLCITITIEPIGRGICIQDVEILSEQDNDKLTHNKRSA
jgi:hypothetical protein